MAIAFLGRDVRPADMNASELDREQKSFDAIPASARAARRFVADTLRMHDASPKVISDYALVVSELVSNIIEHGDGSNMIISLDVADPEWWEVEVVGGSSSAPGNLRRPDTWTVAGSEEASGRGLGIVRHLMDNVAAGTRNGQLSIRCRRRRTDGETTPSRDRIADA
jgi:anti-sigma regulatory factor (Ser/Thr protein kinase)